MERKGRLELLFALLFGFFLGLADGEDVGRAAANLIDDCAAVGWMLHENGERTGVVLEYVLFDLGALFFALFACRFDNLFLVSEKLLF